MKIAAFSVRPDEKQYFDTFAMYTRWNYRLIEADLQQVI